MKRYLFLFALLLFVAPCAMAQKQLMVAGTGDSQAVLRLLAEGFEAANPGTKIIVPDSIGSSGGVKALVKGQADLARIARPLKDKEKKLADDLHQLVFSYSPVVFVANRSDGCVKSISSAQVGAIFSGEINDWSQLGCGKQKIYVAMREEGDSSRSILKKKISEFKAIQQFTGKELYSTPEALQTLEETPFTIGFLPLGIVTDKLKVLSYNDVAPSESNVKGGAYPLVSPFGIVWRGDLAGLAKQFVDYLFSPAAQKLMRDAGVVPAEAR